MYPHPKRVCGLTGDPSQKQIEYAEAISNVLCLSLPAEKTKQSYSDFINMNIKKYKERKNGSERKP